MHPERNEEKARRAYWTEQMEAAYEFMMAVCEYPVEECGEDMVSIPEAVRAAKAEVEFSTTKLGDGYGRLFYLREGMIEDFMAAARDMNIRGWVLKVEDAYRTKAMQTSLGRDKKVFDVILHRVLWERGGNVPSAELMFRRLSALVATRPKVGTHMSGSALDITVLNREDGCGVDRGGPYLELSECTPMGSPFISEEAHQNRQTITGIMARHGFVAYPYEFWHYSKGDVQDQYLSQSGRPARYCAVDMEPASGRTVAILCPEEPLYTFQEIEEKIANTL